MLDALGLRDGEDWGVSPFDDERPPRTCPPFDMGKLRYVSNESRPPILQTILK